jgi:predicted TIM-barrel fold metal-dependent hydrolase
MDSPLEDESEEPHMTWYNGMRILAILVTSLLCAMCQKNDASQHKLRGVTHVEVAAKKLVPLGPPWRPGYVRPAVIDIHTHLSPSALERIRAIVDDNGMDVLVNLSGGSLRRGAPQSVALQEAEPRIVHFMNPDWGLRDHPEFGEIMAKSLKYAVEKLGFKGLKISKALGLYLTDSAGERVPVDARALDPMWAMAGALGVPVAIHTGDPKAFWEPVTHANERYDELIVHPRWSFAGPEHPSRETLLAERDRLLERHRSTTFICVHFGNNPEDLDYVESLLARHPNVVIDTSARLGEIGRHPRERVRRLFITYADRIVFGTDFGLGASSIMLGSTGTKEPTMSDIKPFFDAHWRFFEGNERQIDHPTPIQGDWKIDAINLPDDVLYKLYRGNAERLLKLGAHADHRPDPSVGEELKQEAVPDGPIRDGDSVDPSLQR